LSWGTCRFLDARTVRGLRLDEPDNFLDIPAKLALESRIRTSKKTVLLISHDRDVLSGAVGSIVTLEGNGAWVHGGSYSSWSDPPCGCAGTAET
jgi:ATPase subunit of ABC transporter with duplicated ATPase domains